MIIDLKNTYSILEISGADALVFLQGQMTNDMNKAGSEIIFSGMCNPKGRLFAFVRIAKFNNVFYIISPKQITESIQKKLSMYVLRSQVKICLMDSIQIFGVINQAEYIKSIANNNLIKLITFPNQIDRNIFFCEDMDLTELQLPCETSDDSSTWTAYDISSGIPEIYPETQEKFLPHTCNLDIINAINFQKGCYTGQEIVARTQYLGKPKHRSFFGKVKATNTLIPGQTITHDDSNVGTLVSYSMINDEALVLFEKIMSSPDDNLSLNNQLIMSVKSFLN